MKNKKAGAIFFAVLAAVFYAVNMPCSKLLLKSVASTVMAGFLYLGAGIGIGCFFLFNIRKRQLCSQNSTCLIRSE